ncbi:MAG: hypothetical protein U0Z53_29135 [Blastocatellia bacterium]
MKKHFKGGLFVGAEPRLVELRKGHEDGRSEDWHQIQLFQWIRDSARLVEISPRTRQPEPDQARKLWALRFAHHTANELWIPDHLPQKHAILRKAIAMGLTKGIPDVRIDYPAQGYSGILIELKTGTNDLTKDQEEFRAGAASAGLLFLTCWCWERAAREITSYMNLINHAVLPPRQLSCCGR